MRRTPRFLRLRPSGASRRGAPEMCSRRDTEPPGRSRVQSDRAGRRGVRSIGARSMRGQAVAERRRVINSGCRVTVRRREATMDRTDVVVVGAGYAGLCAARALRAAGRDVVVLEASDRVGGRTRTVRVGAGWAVDLGGQWISGAHTRFATLAEEYGAATYPPPEGVDLLVEGVVRRPFTGARPPLPTFVLVVLAQAMWRLERMAARVDLTRPWATAGADRLDAMTAATWLRRNLPERRARNLAEVMIGEELCVDVGSISMLGLLTTIRSAGGVEAGVAASVSHNRSRITGPIGPPVVATPPAIRATGVMKTTASA
ncbi:flavin monoamine oxidase family protein [Nocardia sp. NPDC004260]